MTAAPVVPPTAGSRRHWLMAVTVLIVGIALSAGIAWNQHTQIEARENARFERLSERLTGALRARFLLAGSALRAATAYVETSEQVSPVDWERYVRKVSGTTPDGIVGLGIAERVARSELDALEQRERAAGRPDFTVQRRGEREVAYIVTQIEPRASNAAALGLDLNSGTTRHAATEEALRTGQFALTRQIPVIFEGTNVPGFLLLAPLFREGQPTGTLEERTAALRGWVYAALRMDVLGEGLLGVVDRQLDLDIFDGTEPKTENMIFDGDGHGRGGRDQDTIFKARTIRSAIPLGLYGRSWLLRTSTLPAFEVAARRELPLLIFFGGFLVSVCAAGATWALLNARSQALRLAAEMTRDLRRAELETRKLALVASRTTNAVVITDAHGFIDWVNEGFVRITGYTLDEIRGRKPGAFLRGQETDPDTVALMREAVEGGRGFNVEVLNYHKSGRPYWVQVDVQPLRGESGEVVGFAGIELDITERRRTAAELARKEAMLRLVFDIVPVGISWLVVGRPSSRMVNAAHVRISGVTAEQVLADPRAYDHVTHPEDLKQQQTALAAMQRGEIEVVAVQKRYLHPGGRVVWAVLTLHQTRDPVTGEEQQVSTLVDITDLRRAQEEALRQEARFRFIFELAPVGMSWLRPGLEGSRVVNPAHEKITGVPARPEISREAYTTVTHPEDLLRQRVLEARIRRGEIDHFTLEKRYLHPDGRVLWAAMTLRMYLDPAGELHEFVTLVDVTALKQQSEELRLAVDAAEQASLAKSQFLAMMSHEIRTPMNGVIGMTSLLLDSELSSEQRDYAETIRNSGDALLTIINDILDFSKIESGRLDLEHEEFIVRECVEGVLDLLAPRAAEKRIDLLYELGEGVPAIVRGDPTRVRQILVNLLSNAIKFTERGEVVLSVQATPLRRSGTAAPFAVNSAEPTGPCQLEIAVRDTGMGIPQEAMSRLFQSFSQVDASTTRRFGGTGLGLAISRRLAEMMGGSMGVESEVGQGSTFRFTIVVEAVAPKARPHAGAPRPAVAGKLVLLVDDNGTNRRILTTLTRKWGMVPTAVSSGAEALALLDAPQAFDVAVLDMQMPEMDGDMLAQEIRKRRDARALPLILLSSLGQRDLVSDSKLFASYLTKPVKPSQLHDVLAQLFFREERPAPEAASVPTVSTVPAAPAMPGVPQPVHPERLLLAEDNAVNQKVALHMLSRLGYRADVAANGLEVLESMQRQTYDIILMDVQMPEMDGLEATRQLRARQVEGAPRPWIVAATANAMQGDRELCLAAGMDDYISKPIKQVELTAALERARQGRAGIGGPSA